jgi:murein DD-endopeptidase MepM/ murein hydrolase activator NlpD
MPDNAQGNLQPTTNNYPMIHLQVPVPGWLEAVERLPDRSLVKVVDQGQVFREVKRINPSIYTCLRHHYDHGQHFGGSRSENIARARTFFDSFVDATFLGDIAPYCDLVEEWNEYLANSQNAGEISDRANWAASAAEVWQNEYRIRPELSHIRLVLCNTAVGNWIPKVFFTIAKSYGCLIGYHPYIHCYRGARSAHDWPDLSGLFDSMELSHKIEVDFIFTEAGPFESAVTGWRSPDCLNRSVESYITVVRDWIGDVKSTAAYQDGRIYGFALFTTGRTGNKWKGFWTEQPELNHLAEMIASEWKSPASQPPASEPPSPGPPGPDPQPPSFRGRPRIQYKRTVNVIPETATEKEAIAVFRSAWRRSRETVSGSYDDAGIGDLDSRAAVLYGIPATSQARYLKWYQTHYPGVNVTFAPLPKPYLDELLLWPVDNLVHVLTYGGDFNEERSYGRHEGIDLYAELGDSILAAADGTVVWADSRRRKNGRPSDYGNHIIIDHGRGFITWYGHLSSMCVMAGDRVLRGDQIGTAGTTGNSTGPHLHFSLQIIGQGEDNHIISDVVNPSPYLGQ